MKISIITVLNTPNYGSCLQTLATQIFFEKRNIKTEFVDYWREDQKIATRIERIKNDKKDTLLKKIKKPIRDIIEIKCIKKTEKVFRGFITKNIHLSDRTYGSFEELSSNPPVADIYATGSDQMWNSSWNNGIEKSFFLEYAPEGKKRIAFATSIGLTEFPKTEEEEIVSLISKYSFITLREKSAVDLLKKYDISGSPVLDPTLMLTKSEWESYIAPRMINEPYLLVYQLHLSHDNANFDEAVRTIAKEKGLKIVRIAYSNSDLKIGKKVVLPEVFEFISLINHADYIVTDSFHGTAFSINLNKEFAVIYPAKFSTRMDNILKLTKIENRRYTTDCDKKELYSKINYTEVNEIMDGERMRVNRLFDEYLESVEV